MTKVLKNSFLRYQLRYAAGQYYLLDMEQPGVPYQRPMELNEIGAKIWQFMAEGRSANNIAEILSNEYEMPIEDIEEDVLQFQKRLATYGVVIEE